MRQMEPDEITERIVACALKGYADRIEDLITSDAMLDAHAEEVFESDGELSPQFTMANALLKSALAQLELFFPDQFGLAVEAMIRRSQGKEPVQPVPQDALEPDPGHMHMGNPERTQTHCGLVIPGGTPNVAHHLGQVTCPLCVAHVRLRKGPN